LGGKPTPAVGFGLGVERLLLLIDTLGVPVPSAAPHVYAVVPDPTLSPKVQVALEALRTAGVAVQMHAGCGSLKSQFKKADASGACFALIFGGDELARGEVTVKSLRDGAGAQVARALTDVADWATTLQSPASSNV